MGYAVTALVLIAVLASLMWLARRVRRSGVGAQLMGPIDEIYRPAAHRYNIEIEAAARRAVPTPPAEDKP